LPKLPKLLRMGGLVLPGTLLSVALTNDGYVVPATLAKVTGGHYVPQEFADVLVASSEGNVCAPPFDRLYDDFSDELPS
jgi:hypothetical protein